MNKMGVFVFSVMLVFVSMFTFVSFESKDRDDDLSDEDNVVGYSYEVGYSEDFELDEKSILFSDYSSLNEYLDRISSYRGMRFNREEIFSKYDITYFNDNSLAIVYAVTGAGNVSIVYEDSVITGNVVRVIYEKEIEGEVGTSDMHGYFVVVELPKSVTEIE